VAAPVAPAAPAAPAEKPKRQWSEAAKASAAEKRAQKKAGAPAAAPAGAPVPATAWASPAQKPSNAAAPAAVVEEDITEFAPVKIQGKSYLRNCRGDLLTEEYDWVGRFENGKINTKFPKPEDLEE
jgi:hypothetical protein